MFPLNPLLTMSQNEKEQLHRQTMRILSEIGVMVENNEILAKLADFGAEIDIGRQIAKFPQATVENHLCETEQFNWDAKIATLDSTARIFFGKYLNPETDQFEDWNETHLKNYVKAARHLPDVRTASMLCCPLSEVPGEIHSLYSKYLNWKMEMAEINVSVLDIDLCPFIEEFNMLREEELGIPHKEGMKGNVFMITPLRFPRTEAEQFLYFADRGYHCDISHMVSLGGSGPVSVPGAVSLHLAECMFISIMDRLYYGTRKLRLWSSVSALDMKSAGFCYGRPEKTIANLVCGQMAVFYKADFESQCGQSDAKQPGVEAGVQKMLTAVPNLFLFKQGQIASGLLSADEVCSPLQLVLDNETAGALRRFLRGVPVNENTLAFDTIAEAGHGGMFMDKMHTAECFREELWDSRLWSSQLLSAWCADGYRTAEKKALEKWRELMSLPDPEPTMSERAERKAQDIMRRALLFKKRDE